jgi:hypothetical protein
MVCKNKAMTRPGKCFFHSFYVSMAIVVLIIMCDQRDYFVIKCLVAMACADQPDLHG